MPATTPAACSVGALHAQGLDLAALDGSAVAEMLAWHDVRTSLPDADITVLAWARDGLGGCDWWSAWWDGERWMDCATGDVVHGTVTHWAQPQGPAHG